MIRLTLPGVAVDYSVAGPHKFHFIEGDATNLSECDDGTFDIVFSNSVIEHVGDDAKRAAFAREVRRLGRGYFVQTPSKYFPLEAHTGLPFWWYYPGALKRYMFRTWERTLPAWGEMVRGTTVVSREELQQLFPDGTLRTERVAGMPKSYTLYRPILKG